MLGHLADLTEFWLDNSQFCSNIVFGHAVTSIAQEPLVQ